MAERTAIFNLKLDDGNSAKKVAENEKNLNKFRKSAQQAGKGTQDFSKRLQSVNKVVDSNAFSFREANRLIQDYQTIAIQAGKDSPIGQEAIKRAAQLTDEMGKLRAETNNLANDGKNLQGAMQLSQGVLGGYQAFAGVTAMLGVENEQLMQTMVKLQAVQQVSMGIESARKSLEEGQAARLLLMNIRTKALTIGTTAYAGAQSLLNAAIGKGSKAMRVFRGALVATGIGALVVGIGMLIANFDKVVDIVQNARKRFNELGEGVKTVISILLPFIGLIRLVGAGLEALGVIESDQDRERERQHQRQTARLKKEQEEIREKINLMTKEHKEFEENGNFEIRMMKAQGASKEEIFKAEQKLRKEIIQNNLARGKQIELDNALLEIQRDRLHAQGKIEEGNELNDELKENNKLIAAINKSNRDLRKEIKIQDAQFKTEQEKAEEQHQEKITKKISDARKKRKEEAEKLEREEQQKIQELQRASTDFMVQNIEDEGLRKRTALRIQHEREREELIEKYGKDSEVVKQMEQNQADEVMVLQRELNKKKTEEEAKEAEKERERKLLKLENDLMQLELEGQETLNKELEIAKTRRDALLEQDELTAEERNKIKLEYAQKEAEINNKRAEDEKKADEAIAAQKEYVLDTSMELLGKMGSLAKEGSAAAKAIAIAEIGAQTAMGFVRGLGIAQQAAAATGPAAPFTMPIFYASQIASVIGAANKARGILGGGGSVSAPPASRAPSPSGSGRDSENQGSTNTRVDAEGRSTAGKVFVSETDISRTQQRVNDIEVRSSF